MSRTNPQESTKTTGRSLRRIAAGCFALVAGIALVMLLLWLLGQWRVATFGHEYVPMAPSTALLFLAIAGAAWVAVRQPGSPALNRFAFLAGLGVLAISSLLGSQFLFDFQLPLEPWLTHTTETVGQIPVGRMSPLTAAVFLLASLALLLGFPRGGRRRSLRQTAALLCLVALFSSGGVALSYGLHEPLLVGGTVVPMAALTAMAFLLISLGMVLTAGEELWPLNLFVVSAPDAPSGRRGTRGLIALALLFTATISTSGWIYFKRQQAEARRTAQETLAAIADLKTNEIAEWIRERRSDAVSLINPIAQQFLADPNQPARREVMLQWMTTLQRVYDYSTVALFDARGTLILEAPADGTRQYTDIAKRVQAAARSQEVVFTDLHRAGPDQPIHMSFLVPADLYAQADPSAHDVLLLVVDPRRFLYPLVQNWPTPSRTAETLLVQREGNEVVFLNDVRHRTDTALSLRLPISDLTLPATMAVNGEEGVVEGRDYRGIPVLAALRQIPGTPWFMVAKVDQAEIYAPLRQQARAISLITSLLLLASMMGVGLLWRQQQQDANRRELTERRQAERALRDNEEKYRGVFNQAAVGVARLAADGTWLAVNQKLCDIVGYSQKELLSKTFADITYPDDLETDLAYVNQLLHGEIQTYSMEKRYIQKKGDLVWSNLTVSLVRDSHHDPDYFISIIEDITDRKQAEAKLGIYAKELQEKNSELERFLYTVSHDLKSPVVTVRTFLGYLEQDLVKADAGRIEKDMRFMRAAADKMAQQLDEVLEMSRIGRIASPSVCIPFRALVDETLAGVAGSIAERGVQVDVADASLSLTGDRIRLVEIWQNLVENAVKFMGDQPAPRIEIGVEMRGEEPVFFVRDNGIGIDPRFQAKIFGLFDKLDAKAEGSGVGLAIVQRIVATLYGGRIWVESEGPGQGTCFYFTLPKAVEEAGAPPTGIGTANGRQ